MSAPAPEPFVPLNGSAGNSAPVGGKRHKLKLVTKKQARKMLKKLGKKMRGGESTAPVPVPEVVEKAAETDGGRRRRGKTRRHRKSRSIFGMATPFRRY